jgi:membrane protein DedA with SNARE-associated domain
MEFITDLLSSYGYYGIFLVLVIGCFGPPIPDEILLIAIGYLAFGGSFDLLRSHLVVITGSFTGIILDYLIGRFLFHSLIQGWIRRSPRLAARMERAQDLVQRFGPGIVAAGYFLPGLRHWVPVVAGLVKAPAGLFGLGAGSGAILWSMTYLTLGYLLAANGVTLAALNHPGMYLAIPGVVFLLLAGRLIKRKFPGEGKPHQASSM